MFSRSALVSVVLSACCAVASLSCVSAAEITTAQQPVVVPAALFPLKDVRLRAGPVLAQQDLNRTYLLKLDPDRLLSWFRREAGLEPKAPPYRGWESESPLLPGHILGFYLSGAGMTVQALGDAELRRRLDYIVAELAAVQDAHGSGYMLAIPDGKKTFADIASGKIKIGGLPWTGNAINDHFEPIYTLNKLLLGLHQVWLATDNPQARQVWIRLADWFGREVLERLDDAQVQQVLECEHGSLNESFVDVFEVTGEQKYLAWSRRLCHEKMLAPLAAGNADFIDRYHANTQIPKYTGFERHYQVTGERTLDAAALNFWNEVVDHRSWVIGGNSVSEHFFPANRFAAAMNDPAGPESCNSVNMLRLTEALFRAHPSATLMDFYERALFNHILAAHDPERGMFVYFTPMKPGAYRVYSDEFDSMWCCVGTGFEVPGKYGQMIFARAADDAALYVNLFVAAELHWRSRNIVVRQDTGFPREAGTRLTFSCAKPTEFSLRIRHPWWVRAEELTLTVNGQPVMAEASADGYACLQRTWTDGDVVTVGLPMRLTTQTLPGDDRYVALLYGPIVLSGTLGRMDLTKQDFWQIKEQKGRKSVPASGIPEFRARTPEDVLTQLHPVAGRPLTFRASGLTTDDVLLTPFYENHFQRYIVYWKLASPDKAAIEVRP